MCVVHVLVNTCFSVCINTPPCCTIVRWEGVTCVLENSEQTMCLTYNIAHKKITLSLLILGRLAVIMQCL